MIRRAPSMAALIPVATVAAIAQTQVPTASLKAVCQTVDDSQRTALTRYVQAKFKLSPTIPLAVAEAEANPGCYRKLDFKSQDSHRPFQITLYASPDLRFLSRELMDVTVDPAVEERRARQELSVKLAKAGDAPVLGPKTAPVTITVFSDFQCPYCAQAAKALTGDILPAQREAVRMEYRYLPLRMHPWARPGAEAAACARQQGDSYFWSLHDYMFEHQRELKPDTLRQSLTDYAAGLTGFDTKAFGACIDSNGASAAVVRDMALASELGITGTPTIFINGERVGGYQPAQIRNLIERALQEQPAASAPSQH